MITPRQILVRAPNWIGDFIMARPFFYGLRECYSNSHLTIACKAELVELTSRTICDRVIKLTASDLKFPTGVWRFGRTLRGQFDLGISLSASYSSALLLYAAATAERVGFASGGSDLFLTQSLPWPGRTAGKHKSQLYLDLLSWLCSRHVTGQGSPLSSFCRVSRQKLLVVAPEASIALREWPYFPELLEWLSTHAPAYRIIVVGNNRESKWHSFLRRLALPNVGDYVEKTTLTELMALCRQASLVIANDSGVAHLAATMSNAKTVVIFGPGDPGYIAPIGESVITVRNKHVLCSPCENARCHAPYGYQTCLKELRLQDVTFAISGSLSG